MSASDQQVETYQEEIQEWEKLKKCTQNNNVKKSIDDRILMLQRLMENLCPAKQCASVTPNKISEPSVSASTVKVSADLYAPITNFSWDQTSTAIRIYITLENAAQVSPEDVLVTFGAESLDVTIKSHTSSRPSQRLYIKKLFKPICPEKCKYRVKNQLLSITLHKTSTVSWEDVRYKEAQKPPTLSKDLDEPNSDPGASLMKLMKNLYDEGDDEMKRTIAKAWSESQSKQGMMNHLGAM